MSGTDTGSFDDALRRDAKPLDAPWTIVECGGYAEVHSADAFIEHIATIYGVNGQPYSPAMMASARLIIAAPAMLALLQELIDIEGPQPGTSTWAGKVATVIAKATGGAP